MGSEPAPAGFGVASPGTFVSLLVVGGELGTGRWPCLSTFPLHWFGDGAGWFGSLPSMPPLLPHLNSSSYGLVLLPFRAGVQEAWPHFLHTTK